MKKTTICLRLIVVLVVTMFFGVTAMALDASHNDDLVLWYESELDFTGTTYLDLGNSKALQPENITLAFWYQRTTDLRGQENVIVWAKPDGSWNGNGWYLTIKDQAHETNRPVLFMVNGNVCGSVIANVNEFYPLDEWVHVAITLDESTKAISIYRNGIAQPVVLTGVPSITATNDPKWLGFNSPAYNGGFLVGKLSDFRIYQRALSAAEVQELAGVTIVEAKTPIVVTEEKSILTEGDQVMQYQPFKLSQVKLLDGELHDLKEVNAEYLYSLEADRLLHMFRVTAGIPSTATPLGGWEAPNMEIRGHTLGHYLSACALLYASDGDHQIKAKADAIVKELEKCQVAHGNGYLSAYPESVFDRLEAGQNAWVPWYSMHKIFAGLYDMYVYADNELAYELLSNLAAWAKSRSDKLSDQQVVAILNVEFGGMNEVLYNLYEISGNPDHLALAHRFDQQSILAPLAAGVDNLAGLHANTQIPKVIGAAKRYEILGEAQYAKMAANFWDLVIKTRSYATGGNSVNEHFGVANELAYTLGNTNHETCNTYNMLKLTRHLFTWTGDIEYANYYERALFNGILGTINPETGMKMYFVPMGTGYFKVFHTHDDSFYCCTGTGMESFAKLTDSIYFHREQELYVNLYIASQLNWEAKGIQVTQETKFPEEQGSKFTIAVQEPTQLAINLRIPEWVASDVIVSINQEPQNVTATPGTYLVLDRVWSDQDTIEITLPMDLHLSPLPDKQDRVAISYGPIVLAGLLGSDNMQINTTGVDVIIPNRNLNRVSYLAVPESERDDVSQWLLPVRNQPLTFQTRLDVGEITFKPFYQVYDQRYGLYWDLHAPADTKLAQEQIDPIVWYSFDKSSDAKVLDQSGNHRHGQLQGGAKLTTDSVRKEVLALDGVNGHVVLPAGIVEDVAAMTISTWVKPQSNSAWARIFDFGSGTGTNMFLTANAGGNPAVRFAITTGGAGSESIFGHNRPLKMDKWTHLVITLDGSQAHLYENGVLVAKTDEISSYPWELGATNRNYLGRSQYPADPYFKGLIDDFRIYNRVLTEGEILELGEM